MPRRIKRIELSVYGPKQKLLRRLKLVPPRVDKTFGGPETADQWKKSMRQFFSEEGAQDMLYKVLGQLDEANPGNQWRLVRIGWWQFKLVWEDPAEGYEADHD